VGIFFFESLRLPLSSTSPFCRCQIHYELINSQRKKKLALALSLQMPTVTIVNSSVSNGGTLFLCGSGHHAGDAWGRCHYPYTGWRFLLVFGESKAVLSLEGLYLIGKPSRQYFPTKINFSTTPQHCGERWK